MGRDLEFSELESYVFVSHCRDKRVQGNVVNVIKQPDF